MKILLKGGRVVDPSRNFSKVADVLIENGKIKKIAADINEKARTFKVGGLVVCPGLIDIHVHLREPGREDEETIATGTRAAAKGGFTTVCAMPNTNPAVDSVSGVKYILMTAAESGIVRVLPYGAITKGRRGEELTEIGKMKKAGIVGISDDGTSVMNARVMRRAMEYSKMFDIPVVSHCEDLNLSAGGVMNEGRTSTILGLRGIPPQAEEVMVARDIALAELTGARLHLAHITTKRSVALVREAKKRKIKVTAEATPHHLFFTDKFVEEYNTNAKVNPPLRSEEDRVALMEGLRDGTIDCVASDHAPHLDTEKNKEFDFAPFGVIGLETALPVVITALVKKKKLSLMDVISKMSTRPAEIIGGHDLGKLVIGGVADITVIDLNKKKKITSDFFVSKSANSPFIGKNLSGFAVLTIFGGKVVFRDL
ncbi:MAG: dihydroorotase [Elusimicrobia bacterium]|nr:dihydroorotase [Elusimicrobiota bacterium]